jgi:hypothetical protein
MALMVRAPYQITQLDSIEIQPDMLLVSQNDGICDMGAQLA